MRQVVGLWLGVALLVCAGCATHTVWTGQPSVQTIVRVGYKITLEPGYDNEGGFFTHFNISVANTGPDTLEIDWRRSQYLHNGTAKGHFIFEGVNEKNAQSPPADTIPSGKQLNKEIWPLSLLAIAPYRSNNVPSGERGFSRGILPAGENSLDLVLELKNRTIRERITLMLIEERVP